MGRRIRSTFGAGRGRWWRPLYPLALTYAVVVIAFNTVLLSAVGVAQLVADDPRVSGPEFPDVKLWGTRNRSRCSGGRAVLVDQAAQPASSSHPR